MTIESAKMTPAETVPFTSEIKVNNFEQSIKFYREKLGFEVLRTDEDGRFATLVFNKGQFLIQEDGTVEEPKG